MTSKLTRERLQEIAEDGFLKHGESKELARMALTAMDSDPVAEVVSIYGDPEAFGEREIRPLVGIQQMPYGTKLYRHAQPASVVDSESVQMFDLGSIFKPQIVSEQEADCHDCAHYNPKICHGEGCPAISEKPAQLALVVPEGITVSGAMDFGEQCYADGWNKCRAAMLKGDK
ncbi:hypothetical protein NOX19_000124 [Klebsiella aerogenes]